MIHKKLCFRDHTYEVHLQSLEDNTFFAGIDGKESEVSVKQIDEHRLLIGHSGGQTLAYVTSTETEVFVHLTGETFRFQKAEASVSDHRPGMEEAIPDGNVIEAPMPGKILKMFVKEGQKISRNDRLFIVEAMKMENEVRAFRDGVIRKINFRENDLVSLGEAVIEFAETSPGEE